MLFTLQIGEDKILTSHDMQCTVFTEHPGLEWK